MIKGKQVKYEQPQTGLNHAVVSGVFDIGTQVFVWEGKRSENPQIVILIELAEKMKDGENAGKPFQLIHYENLYMSKKAKLRADINAMLGRTLSDEEAEDFDIESLVGKNIFVNLIEKGERVKIASFAKPPAGTPPLIPVNKGEPEWITKKRAGSLEAQAGGQMPGPGGDDTLPF